MDHAKMPNNADQSDSSDDLIAELARLMAEDAQGGPSASPAPQEAAPSSQDRPAPKPFVRVPGQEAAAPTPATPTPTAPTATAAPKPDSLPPVEADTPVSPPAPVPNPFAASRQTPQQAPAAQQDPVAQMPQAAQTPQVSQTVLGDAMPANPATERAVPGRADGSSGSVASELQTLLRNEPKSQSQPESKGVFAEVERALAEQNHMPALPQETAPAFPSTLGGSDPIADLIAAEQKAFQSTPASELLNPDPQARVPDAYAPQTAVPQATVPQPAAPVPAPVAPVVPVSSGPSATDNFEVPPVFGLGGPTRSTATPTAPNLEASAPPPAVAPTPAAPVSAAHLAPTPTPAPVTRAPIDPLDEIEQLIGEAVRLGTQQDPVASVAEPADSDFSVDEAALAADAAIRAVSQPDIAVDSPTAFPNDTFAAQSDVPPSAAPGRNSGFSVGSLQKYMAPIVAGTVFLAIAVALFLVFGLNNGTQDGEAPVLTANTQNAKVEPEVSTSEPTVTDQSVVFNSLDGQQSDRATEQLVPRQESTTSSDVTRVIDTTSNDTGLANRKVRTVTVRPDGSIVSGQDSVAGNEALPVERPNVPALPADVAAANSGEFQAVSEFVEQPVITDPSSVNPAEATAGAGDVVLNAPIPAPRIADRSAAAIQNQATTFTNIAPPQTTTITTLGTGTQSSGAVDLLGNAATTTVAAPVTNIQPTTQQAAPQITTAAAYVQMSSQRSQEAAQQTITTLERQFASQLGGGRLEIQRVDLADRGTFFRVLLPVSSRSQAGSICNSIISAGGDCIVRN